MATRRSRRPAAPQRLHRDLMEQLLFGIGRARRFTQDSPVLPDVWLEYAKQPTDEVDRAGAGAGAERAATRRICFRPSSCCSRRTAK